LNHRQRAYRAALALAMSSVFPHASTAQSDACADGYVWREAVEGDHVCVSPGSRELAKADNANAEQFRARRGSDECVQGFVWRLAKPEDHVCVSETTREQTAQENAVAYSRLASGPPEAFRAKERALPPAKVGCHIFKDGEWREVPCATPEEMRRLPPPAAALSIKNSQKYIFVKDRAYPFTLSLQLGAIDIELDSDPGLGTVTDVVSPGACSSITTTKSTRDSFSIQLNTNFFPMKSGNTGWVQFVNQTLPDPNNPSKDALCVWEVDVTIANATGNNQGYKSTCVYPDRATTFLGAARAGIGGQIAEVKGFIRKQGGATLLTAWAQLPWAGPGYSAAITTPDTTGLSGNWTQVSGDIYGTGCGSRAEFSGTRISERLVASTCTLYPYCSSLSPLTPFSLPHFAAPAVDPRVTAESNNLVRTLQTYGVPGTGSRAFYCPYSEVCELVEQVHSPN
jgi:hypothetical protein